MQVRRVDCRSTGSSFSGSAKSSWNPNHPRFGKALKEKMDELGIECEVHTGIPRGDEWTKLTVDFVKKHLDVE